jgi:hypothetical protein
VLSADDVKYSPPGHSVVLVVHDVTAFVPVLYSVTAHAVHVASACVDPAVKYWPGPHCVLRSWHGPYPFVSEYVVAVHAVHADSSVVFSAAVRLSQLDPKPLSHFAWSAHAERSFSVLNS